MTEQQAILECMQRIESKLDTLLEALAEDDEDAPRPTLDGDPGATERDQTQSLG